MKKVEVHATQKKRTYNMGGDERCGATTKQLTKCKLPRGFGTDHEGIGYCKYHGGTTINHRKAAVRQEAIIMGAPLDINPLDAMIWCIRITAGEVKWLSEKIAELDDTEAISENQILGDMFHLYIRERADRVERLTSYSEKSIKLNLTERAIKLQEQYGQMIAALLKGILLDLQLTKEQREQAPFIVARWLGKVEATPALPPGIPDADPQEVLAEFHEVDETQTT